MFLHTIFEKMNVMRTAFTILLFFLLSEISGMSRTDTLPVYNTVRIGQAPKIDGKLDDACWSSANKATRWIQYSPSQGNAPSQNTEVMIVYDDFAIYVGARMFDTAPDSILRELGTRDNWELNADDFKVGFDPYNNRLDAYIFEVTASGAERETRTSDATFDAVWESKVIIDELGWVAELRIPYSAIRFPSTPEQEWVLQFGRTIRRLQEYDQWAYVPRGTSNSVQFWGRMQGISNINAPTRLSFTPFLSVIYDRAPEFSDATNYKYTNSYSYNFGADMKYGIDDRFTLDLTLLPDFSQVQSDAKIKNLSYNEVVYTENRQFFKEGTDLFNKNQLFYSRRIGKTPAGYYNAFYEVQEGETLEENPSQVTLLNATKISGRNNNGMGIGVFNAVTDNMYAVIKDSDGNKRRYLTEPLTNYNILVLDQQLKNSSSIYLINTNVMRSKKGNDANVTGTGATFYTKDRGWATDLMGALSQKYSPDDSTENLYTCIIGSRYFIGARKANGRLQYGLSHTFISENYDSRDMGYQVNGNMMRERVYLTLNFFKPNKAFIESSNSLTLDYWSNPATKNPTYFNTAIDLYATLPNYMGLSLHSELHPGTTYDYFEPRVPGRYSRNWKLFYNYIYLSTDTRKQLGMDITLYGGKYLNEYNDGEGFSINSNVRYRMNNHTMIKAGAFYNDDTYNMGFADIEPDGTIIYGGRYLKTWVVSADIRYMFQNDMYLSLVGRHYWNTGKYIDYFTLLENGELEINNTYNAENNFSYNAFNIDVVYSWQFAPGSIFSVSYKYAIEANMPLSTFDYIRNFEMTFENPNQSQVSVKFLYFLDYLYVKKWLT